MKKILASTIGKKLYVVHGRGAIIEDGKWITIIELALDVSKIPGKGYETIDNENEYLTFEISTDKISFMPPTGYRLGLKKAIAITPDGEYDAFTLYELEPHEAGDNSSGPFATPGKNGVKN